LLLGGRTRPLGLAWISVIFPHIRNAPLLGWPARFYISYFTPMSRVIIIFVVSISLFLRKKREKLEK
jgi:hypothetical protein